jgi:hypothetical protein
MEIGRARRHDEGFLIIRLELDPRTSAAQPFTTICARTMAS